MKENPLFENRKKFSFYCIHLYGNSASMKIQNGTSEVDFKLSSKAQELILKAISENKECQDAIRDSLNTSIGLDADLIFLK